MQNTFKVEESFWNLFPDTLIGVVIAKDIDNRVKANMNYRGILTQGMSESKYHIQEPTFTDNPVVAVWRDAYKPFKTKKGARASIEAMLKRVDNGKGIGPINPLVDIYNYVSLKYGFPCGGEDIDSFSGPVLLTRANGTESFVTLGSDKSEPPYEGEVVYKDQEGAICRCWNWRESARTMLTEETKNAFLCLELIQPERHIEFNQALLELKKTVEAYLGGKVSIHVVSVNNKELHF
jgi:DNA/RNA-binding domain of Phe-tRNA-synthetase-like protein